MKNFQYILKQFRIPSQLKLFIVQERCTKYISKIYLLKYTKSLLKMIYFDDVTEENREERNQYWPQIPHNP